LLLDDKLCAQVRVPADEARVALAVYSTLALVVLTSAFVAAPVRDAASGAAATRRAAGVHPLAHWPAALAVDYVVYGAVAAAVLALLVASEAPGLGVGGAAMLGGGFALYGVAAVIQVCWLASCVALLAMRQCRLLKASDNSIGAQKVVRKVVGVCGAGRGLLRSAPQVQATCWMTFCASSLLAAAL
jgi:hypothetical protein